jgi:hypothetical protein
VGCGGRPPLGVLLAGGGSFLLLYPLVQGRELGWPAWTFAMLGLGLVIFGLFAVFESRRDAKGLDPLVTPSLFHRRSFTAGLGVGLGLPAAEGVAARRRALSCAGAGPAAATVTHEFGSGQRHHLRPGELRSR